MQELKVSSKSKPQKVAGAILGVLRDQPEAELLAIGAGASNQAIKAVAIARNMASSDGIDIVCVPAFGETSIDDRELTIMRLIVKTQKIA